jgi:hypothetical protein
MMPAAEFDYSALKQFKTSSKDDVLLDIAEQHGAKYTTSTSSFTPFLQHLHFLLSKFRELNHAKISRLFSSTDPKMTTIQYTPVSAFLRRRNGVYALDKDKSFDDHGLLSFVGRVLEKMFTVPKEKFEQFRRFSENPLPEAERGEDDAYHYLLQDKFLVRSQLDAHDPRLPGSGVFDIKTRAVMPIRLDVAERLHDVAKGYQLKYLNGDFESFEREFYDMMRTTMLKYSLQVRLGKMDGIFISYHNVERLFGFQYLSLEDMDTGLHGQSKRALGDQELKASVSIMQEVCDIATARFPDQVRICLLDLGQALGLTWLPSLYGYTFKQKDHRVPSTLYSQ